MVHFFTGFVGLRIPSNIPRHPPPPQRRSVVGPNEKEEEINTGQRAYYLRRCESSSSSLSDDAWFEILTRLPAQDVYDLARLVCWKWYRMIYTPSFINANLQNAPYGLLFTSNNIVAFFLTMQQGQIELSELRHRFFPFMICSSCNGLSLEFEERNPRLLYIINPLTKQVFVLPPTNLRIEFSEACSIGYASASMKYKVVITALYEGDSFGWVILTPGVDSSWRVFRTDHIPHVSFIVDTPLITEGFMHWTLHGNEVLTLDLETEILTKSRAPVGYRANDRRCWYYLSTGKWLTLLISDRRILWDVWEMRKPGEWRKMEDVVIDFGTRMYEQPFIGCKHISPVGWLNYSEVLVFQVYQLEGTHAIQIYRIHTYLYNLLTKEIKLFELPHGPPSGHSPVAVVHKNSLAWLA